MALVGWARAIRPAGGAMQRAALAREVGVEQLGETKEMSPWAVPGVRGRLTLPVAQTVVPPSIAAQTIPRKIHQASAGAA